MTVRKINLSNDDGEKSLSYTATVTFRWTSEVFEGDPDDVFQLAEAEKAFLNGVCDNAAVALDPISGEFEIISVAPVLDNE